MVPCLPACSFLMAESNDALFVAFMGTKRPRDIVTNVNLFQARSACWGRLTLRFAFSAAVLWALHLLFVGNASPLRFCCHAL